MAQKCPCGPPALARSRGALVLRLSHFATSGRGLNSLTLAALAVAPLVKPEPRDKHNPIVRSQVSVTHNPCYEPRSQSNKPLVKRHKKSRVKCITHRRLHILSVNVTRPAFPQVDGGFYCYLAGQDADPRTPPRTPRYSTPYSTPPRRGYSARTATPRTAQGLAPRRGAQGHTGGTGAGCSTGAQGAQHTGHRALGTQGTGRAPSAGTPPRQACPLGRGHRGRSYV